MKTERETEKESEREREQDKKFLAEFRVKMLSFLPGIEPGSEALRAITLPQLRRPTRSTSLNNAPHLVVF